MEKNMGDIGASIFCSMDRIEAIGKVLIYIGPDHWSPDLDTRILFQNFGMIIEEEAESIKKVVPDIEDMDYYLKKGDKIRAIS